MPFLTKQVLETSMHCFKTVFQAVIGLLSHAAAHLMQLTLQQQRAYASASLTRKQERPARQKRTTGDQQAL
jgi:hypothetical protein